jgi:Uncharacterised nucleotidyltransferase
MSASTLQSLLEPMLAVVPGSSEHTLALALSKRDLLPSECELIKDAIASVDDTFSWGKFVDTCARHGIMPLVGHHLHTLDLTLGHSGQSLVPYRWLYSHVYAGNLARNQILATEYGHLLKSLNEAHLRYLVRKGPVLLEHLHGDLGVRRVGDMDLLVPKEDLELFRTVTENEGYVCGHRTSNRHELVSYDRATSMFWKMNLPNVHLPFLKVADSDLVEVFVVDYCLSLFQPGADLDFSFDDFHDRSSQKRLWGVLAPAMHPLDQIIDVCVQFHVEATSLYYIELGKDITLLKLTEIAELVRIHLGTPDSVLSLMGRAEELGCRVSVFYALWHVGLVHPSSVSRTTVERMRGELSIEVLNSFGELDGNAQTWDQPFIERLFDTSRSTQSSGSSSVPGPRAVI